MTLEIQFGKNYIEAEVPDMPKVKGSLLGLQNVIKESLMFR